MHPFAVFVVVVVVVGSWLLAVGYWLLAVVAVVRGKLLHHSVVHCVLARNGSSRSS